MSDLWRAFRSNWTEPPGTFQGGKLIERFRYRKSTLQCMIRADGYKLQITNSFPWLEKKLWIWRQIVDMAPYCVYGARLCIWHQIVDMAPDCGCDAILWKWRQFLYMAPDFGYRARLCKWRQIMYMAPDCGYGAILWIWRQKNLASPPPRNGWCGQCHKDHLWKQKTALPVHATRVLTYGDIT